MMNQSFGLGGNTKNCTSSKNISIFLGKIQYGGALSLFKTDDTLKEDAIE
jgi:hypothetical protein